MNQSLHFLKCDEHICLNMRKARHIGWLFKNKKPEFSPCTWIRQQLLLCIPLHPVPYGGHRWRSLLLCVPALFSPGAAAWLGAVLTSLHHEFSHWTSIKVVRPKELIQSRKGPWCQSHATCSFYRCWNQGSDRGSDLSRTTQFIPVWTHVSLTSWLQPFVLA
jgi:hypothetical protein